MLKRFLVYYKPYKWLFSADMIASLIMAALGLLYPIITRALLNGFLTQTATIRFVTQSGLVLLGLYVIRMLLKYFVEYYGHSMGTKMQAQMRRDMFNHLQKLPYTFYDNNETGHIISRMTSDLFEISELAHHGPENLLVSGISVIGAFIYLATVNLYLTLIIFVAVPFMLFIALVLRKRMRLAFQKRREANAKINASLESSVSGIRVTKAFNNSQIELNKFEVGNGQFQDASLESYKAMGQFHSATSFITDIFNVIVLIAGGIFLYQGQISVSDYSAFIVSVSLFITPITTLINFMEQYQTGVTGFERFLQIMDSEPEKETPGAEEMLRADGKIEFDDVSFSYVGRSGILEHISFTIDKGKTYALVGHSGGGKTTICHLIPRFYELDEGRILIDGSDISKVTRESLRKNIGIVQQDVYLFNASVRDNILYGRPDASEEEVIEAAKRANIHDYILTLPNGYDTVIGERGVKLSGGQKQRLSIARVFLKNPPILILDEATSALDNATEIFIQEALDELCKGRTTIVVAHRLSTIKHADEIAVIDHGHIIERGTHDELVAKDGVYAMLYKQQFREN